MSLVDFGEVKVCFFVCMCVQGWLFWGRECGDLLLRGRVGSSVVGFDRGLWVW